MPSLAPCFKFMNWNLNHALGAFWYGVICSVIYIRYKAHFLHTPWVNSCQEPISSVIYTLRFLLYEVYSNPFCYKKTVNRIITSYTNSERVLFIVAFTFSFIYKVEPQLGRQYISVRTFSWYIRITFCSLPYWFMTRRRNCDSNEVFR